ncbi:hypothetical protein K1X76_00415 [bacterium]|nr:hypothetical protein [bacterium]
MKHWRVHKHFSFVTMLVLLMVTAFSTTALCKPCGMTSNQGMMDCCKNLPHQGVAIKMNCCDGKPAPLLNPTIAIQQEPTTVALFTVISATPTIHHNTSLSFGIIPQTNISPPFPPTLEKTILRI